MTPDVWLVIGTRPELIKTARLVQLAREQEDNLGWRLRLVSTGQHREMLAGLFEFFEIKPDLHLDVMKPGQGLNSLSAAVLRGMDDLFRQEGLPAMVLVQGDTTTAVMASWAAFQAGIPVGHIEAGLRTGDRFSPWPEELNRRVISLGANWHFAPTWGARQALLAEGVADQSVFVTGNTGIDALFWARGQVAEKSRKFLPFGELPFVLCTLHRRESFGPDLERIFLALMEVSRTKNVPVLCPLHRNPAVRNAFSVALGRALPEDLSRPQEVIPGFWLTDPLEYPEFVRVMSRARVVVTDSGGIQEEAPSLGLPVIVVRDRTERPEAVDAGAAVLVGRDPALLRRMLDELWEDGPVRQGMAKVRPLFGDGNASSKIIEQVSLALKAGGKLD